MHLIFKKLDAVDVCIIQNPSNNKYIKYVNKKDNIHSNRHWPCLNIHLSMT